MDQRSDPAAILDFGRFRLLRQRRELLSAVYARFTEGFGSADLVEAKKVLEALG